MSKTVENYLDKIPSKNPEIRWNIDDDRNVILEIGNKGIFNRIAQKLFKKAPVSYVHLEKFGSFIWENIDGEKNIGEIGELLKDRFGREAEPIFERLCTYCSSLDSYGFIRF